MKLSELVVGQKAKILGYEGVSMGHRKKLLAMGLLPQSRVHFVRVAPFGDPMQINTSSISLALRKALGEKITVEVIA